MKRKQKRNFKFRKGLLPPRPALLLLAMATMVVGCSEDEKTSNATVLSKRVFGCKANGEEMYYSNTSSADTFGKESIVCEGSDGGLLYIRHENALYNCEPDRIELEATIEGRTITLTEEEVNPKGNCICPYDLECTIGSLSNGKYTLVVYRNGDTSPYAKFPFNYDSELKQIHNL